MIVYGMRGRQRTQKKDKHMDDVFLFCEFAQKKG